MAGSWSLLRAANAAVIHYRLMRSALACRDNRGGAVVDGADDLGVIDATRYAEVSRGSHAQLTLDDHDRNALARHRHSVSMAKLMIVPT